MVNYTKFFSDVALARKPSPIRVLTAIQAAAGPEMISLAGGQELVKFRESRNTGSQLQKANIYD